MREKTYEIIDACLKGWQLCETEEGLRKGLLIRGVRLKCFCGEIPLKDIFEGDTDTLVLQEMGFSHPDRGAGQRANEALWDFNLISENMKPLQIKSQRSLEVCLYVSVLDHLLKEQNI